MNKNCKDCKESRKHLISLRNILISAIGILYFKGIYNKTKADTLKSIINLFYRDGYKVIHTALALELNTKEVKELLNTSIRVCKIDQDIIT